VVSALIPTLTPTLSTTPTTKPPPLLCLRDWLVPLLTRQPPPSLRHLKTQLEALAQVPGTYGGLRLFFLAAEGGSAAKIVATQNQKLLLAVTTLAASLLVRRRRRLRSLTRQRLQQQKYRAPYEYDHFKWDLDS
jgi:hypothetical protein